MKYLKLFENYKGPIYDKSLFTQEDMNELYDIFQDFAIEYNIKDMTLPNTTLPSQFDDDPDTGEINQYIIGQARNAFVDLRLFINIEEIIEALKHNFIPMVKNTTDWYIPSYQSSQRHGMTLTHGENDIETPYVEITITFAKRNI